MSETREKNRKNRKEQKQQMIEDAEAQNDGLSVNEVAKILGMTTHAVRRIEKIALNKLRAPTEANQKLHKYSKIHLVPVTSVEI